MNSTQQGSRQRVETTAVNMAVNADNVNREKPAVFAPVESDASGAQHLVWSLAVALAGLSPIAVDAREDEMQLPPSRSHYDHLSTLPDLGESSMQDSTAAERCRQTYRYDDSMINAAHLFLSQRACEQALWFDNFFGNEESTDVLEYARTFIRVSHTETFRWEDEIEQDSKLRIRARVKLPSTERRFGIILSGESKNEAATLADSENVTGTANERDEGNVTATFRWAEGITDRLGLDFDLSARFTRGQPIGIARTTFRQGWALGVYSDLYFREEVFWRTDDEGFGGEIKGAFNHRINAQWLYSIDSEVYHSEDSDGFEWELATGFSQKWKPRIAVGYSIGASGRSQPHHTTDNYGLNVRFRSNIHEGWLFFEVQPRMDFPDDRDREPTPAISLKLEAHFGAE